MNATRTELSQIEQARMGLISPEVAEAAKAENIDADLLRQRIADGTAVICLNRKNGETIWQRVAACWRVEAVLRRLVLGAHHADERTL